MATKMKKIISLITLGLILPSLSIAAVTVPWSATSTTAGVITPNKVNAVEQTVQAKNFTATSSTDISNFAGMIKSTFPESFRSAITNGIYSFYDTTNTIRLGYVQGTASGLRWIAENVGSLSAWTASLQRWVTTNSGQVIIGTTTESQAAEQDLTVNREIGANGYRIGTTTNAVPIVFDGDSLTYGNGGTGAPYNSYITFPTFNGIPITSYNIAVPSITTQEAFRITPRNLNPKYSSNSGMNMTVIWLGTNNCSTGDSASTTFSYLKEFGRHQQSLGWNVIMLTMISRVGNEPCKNSLNSLIRANWPEFANGLADVAADPNLGADGAYLNLTYFNADQVHLNDTGYMLVASIVQPVINFLITGPANALPAVGPIGIGTTTTPNPLTVIGNISGGNISATGTLSSALLADGCTYSISGVLTSTGSSCGSGGGGSSTDHWATSSTQTRTIIPSGGTDVALVLGRTSTTTNSLFEANGTTTATNFVATSTIATSTFAGGFTAALGKLVAQQTSGWLGIGLNPVWPLTVLLTNSGVIAGFSNGNDSQLTISNSTPGAVDKAASINTLVASSLKLGVNNVTSILVASSTGFVGIGPTSTPAQILSVQGNEFISGNITNVANVTATGTLQTVNLYATGSSTLQDFTARNATTTNATTTALFAQLASTTQLYATTITIPKYGTPAGQFTAFDPSGNIISTSTPSGSGSPYPFPLTGNATSSPVMLLASTTIGAGATTTGLTVFGGATTTLGTYLGGNVSMGVGATTISTAGAEIMFQETGDQFGSMAFHLQNRNGVGGALFENNSSGASAGVIDFVFKPDYNSSASQRNIRIDNRSFFGKIKPTNGPEMLLNVASNNRASLVMNDGANAFLGSLGINTYNASSTLDVLIYNSALPYQFRVASSSTALATSTSLIIDNLGNVGIGTSSPYSTLSVVGQVVGANYVATTTATSTLPNVNATTGLKAANYYSSDGTVGFTGTCTILGLTSIVVKNGLIVSCI